jgi:hypothetical protein
LALEFEGLSTNFGGVGSRRGRTNRHEIHSGDVLDFWRVLYANKEEGKLVLYAEMKLVRHGSIQNNK